jgi:hypothetical protein
MLMFRIFLLVSFFSLSASAQKGYEWKQTSSGGYTYKYVTNDPMATRFLYVEEWDDCCVYLPTRKSQEWR